MPALRNLNIDGHEARTSAETFGELARVPAIPTLSKLGLSSCTMDYADFNSLVSKHLANLARLWIFSLRLINCSTQDFERFLRTVGNAASLQRKLGTLKIIFLSINGQIVHFHAPVETYCWNVTTDDDEEENGWVTVERNPSIAVELTGVEDIVGGVEFLIDRMA